MPTQRGGYFTQDGKRIPSVTTILSRYKESGALIHWAAGQSAKYIKEQAANLPLIPYQQYNLGHIKHAIDRFEVLKLCDAAKTAYRTVRDDAAEAGTLAHDAVEHWIKGDPVAFDESESGRKAKVAFDAFMEWSSQTQLKVTHTEVALISEKHKFGGTLDAMMIRKHRSLGDWKTSNSVYGDYLCQIAAYSILWDENFPDDPVTGGYHLLRFDKTYGDFHAHYWAELETAKRAFLLMRELYELDTELKQRAK